MKTCMKNWALAACVMSAAMLAGCDDDKKGGGEGFDKNTLAFTLKVDNTTTDAVTVQVEHNGTDDVTYWAFCYDDFSLGDAKAISQAVNELKASGQDIGAVLHTGASAAVTVGGLEKDKEYKFVAVGMDAKGDTYGTPASIKVSTARGEVEYKINDAWSVSYMGKQSSGDGAAYGDAIQVLTSSQEDYFFIEVMTKAEYDANKADMKEWIAGAIARVQQKVDEDMANGFDDGWGFYLHNNNVGMIFDLEDQSGEYVGVAVGADLKGRATGLYAVSEPFTPEVKEASEAYKKWLGNWTMTGKGKDAKGQEVSYSYDISITQQAPDQRYTISGYASDEEVQFPPFQVNFDQASGEILFVGQYVDEAEVDGVPSQLYFYGTVTQGTEIKVITGTYPIAVASLQAEGSYAQVTALETEDRDGQKLIPTEMQYIAQKSSEKGFTLLGNGVPSFPLSMVKKADTPAAASAFAAYRSRLIQADKQYSFAGYRKAGIRVIQSVER